MKKFKGFSDSDTFTQLPDALFHKLLNEIEDAAELKVTLYFVWRTQKMEGPSHAQRETDFDPKALGLAADEVRHGLEKAVQRGTILRAQHEADVVYFLNSPRGRAAAEAFAKGLGSASGKITSAPPLERPNIFKLYEENIGPLTPLIADMLKEAEELYREEWLKEAFILAVKNNKRNWKYVEAILRRWKEEGTHGQKDKQNIVKDSDKYTDSQFSELLKRD